MSEMRRRGVKRERETGRGGNAAGFTIETEAEQMNAYQTEIDLFLSEEDSIKSW